MRVTWCARRARQTFDVHAAGAGASTRPPAPQVILDCLHEMFKSAKDTMHWLR